ncbi:MAG: formylglycine-generating enzyme family protein [Planctomycetota bacterium]
MAWVAGALGMHVVDRPEPPESEPEIEPTIPDAVPQGRLDLPLAEPDLGLPAMASVPIWRVVEFEALADPDDDPPNERAGRPEMRAPDLTPAADRYPVWPPLLPWPRLRALLFSRLRDAAVTGLVDIPRLVDQLARGREVHRLPRAVRRTRPGRVALIVDRSRRLIPFWQDQDTLYVELRRWLGPHGVEVWLPLPGPDAFELRRVSRGRETETAPDPGVPWLALSDLGSYAGADEVVRWQALGRRLRRAGHRLHALVPCPKGRWAASCESWRAMLWDRPARAASAAEADAARAERLLTWLAPAVRIEPGLLRSVRHQLPADLVDTQTEVAAWRHESVQAATAVALAVRADVRKRHLERWGRWAEQDPGVAQRVVEAIARWHAPLSREIHAEEVLDVAAVQRGVVADAAVETAKELLQALCADAGRGPAESMSARHAWLCRVATRTADLAYEHPEIGPVRVAMWKVGASHDPESTPPPGVHPGDLEPSAHRAVTRWAASQVGVQLRLTRGAGGAGSPWAHLEMRRPVVTVRGSGRHARQFRLFDGDEAGIDLPDAVEDAAWAPGWSSDAGEDGYGRWVALSVGGVVQRFRWVPPGRFAMGSPASEWGRFDDEVLHDVVITRGYWLAETPCTQALWTAVLGDHPSGYAGATRPVEQVSFEDVERFLRALGGGVDAEDGFRLPTEAEWEFACRAGTRAATYAGDFDEETARRVLDPIAWFSGNADQTQPVAAKNANPLGLHDMLGNVHEWCRDRVVSSRHPPTDRAEVIDPVGLEGSRRVVRGGSWDGVARNLRAAFRDANAPDGRCEFLGFRLARGQGAPEQGAAEVGAGRAAEVARGSPLTLDLWTDRGRWRVCAAPKPDWAVAHGRDEFGAWADLEVRGVVQRMRWIPPGRFIMGSPESQLGRWEDEVPHGVGLTDGWWFAETPCTQALWEAVLEAQPEHADGPQHPVRGVSFEEVEEFLARLPLASVEDQFRLPTEAEWEYACRAGTATATYVGDLEAGEPAQLKRLDRIGWYEANSGGSPHPVAEKLPNPWGLYDTLGSVLEWCVDRAEFDGNAVVTDSYVDGVANPVSLEGSERVVRGGSWRDVARFLRAAFRHAVAPGVRNESLGFRLARGPVVRRAGGAAKRGAGRAAGAAPKASRDRG